VQYGEARTREVHVVKEYANDAVVVTWNAERCIHTGICTAGLPTVFDVARRPWIQLEGADADAVLALVRRCPTGALRARRFDEDAAEPATADVTIRSMRNGPLYVEGPVRVVSPDGETITTEDRVALCRCGGTRRPPFCDNAHREIGYRSPEPLAGDATAASPAEICRPQDFGG
jgi:uncharacterized Fe-S cluster protein YjdI/CDGSH-type Zn-finger protein